jgi:ubiquinone biosynthesis protein
MLQLKNKRQLKRLSTTIVNNGFGGFLHELNLLHVLPFKHYRKRDTFTEYNLDPQSLANLLMELGPGYVEVGKIVATRSDLVPERYQNSLLNNATALIPVPEKKFKTMLRAEIGKDILNEILDIEQQPYRINLVSQTNKVTFKNGIKALVTINHPKEIIELTKSLEIIEWLYMWILSQCSHHERGLWESIWQEFEQRVLLLTDLKQVAGRVEMMRAHYEENAYINIDRILWEYTTQNVLVQEWYNYHQLHEIGVLEKPMLQNIVDSLVYQYGVSGVFVLRPNVRDIQIAENNDIVFNHVLGTGILEPDERKQFIAIVYSLLSGEPELAAKVMLCNHYQNTKINDRYFGAGISIPKPSVSNVSELVWDLLEHAWQGDLHVPLGFSMAAESILYLQHALLSTNSEVDINIFMKSAIEKNIPEIFGMHSSADAGEIVKKITSV